ncbi:hypothetical protein HDU92_004015 [Lobulomyces angularis]|nr:hypothetical protein HDU92_004015 [Lobulomyces angularis]
MSMIQQSLILLEKLYCIPGFETYLFPQGYQQIPDHLIRVDIILWDCFRLGASLCYLMNQTQPRNYLIVPDVSLVQKNSYTNTCKKSVYHFLISCKQEFNIPEEDLFNISELYKNDTSGFMKVLKTVTFVTDILFSQNRYPKRPLPFTLNSSANFEATDNRSKVIKELIVSERKYVLDLEDLHNYSQEVENLNLLNSNQISKLFANLSELLDFQRNFLLRMEGILSTENPKIGSLFAQHEQSFKVYEKFCANYKTASKLVLSETTNLQRLSHMIEPSYGLPSYLIKPIQRICKYPLLLKELIKYSEDQKKEILDDLIEGEEAIKRVTHQVNEQKRLEENQDTKNYLKNNLESQSMLNFDDFGDLLLHDKFPLISQGESRDFQLFLFEKVILCAQEIIKKKKKKASTNLNDENIQYSLKGNIYISSIENVLNTSEVDKQLFNIKINWVDGNVKEAFNLNCRNIEQVDLWMGRLIKLVENEKISNMQHRKSFYLHNNRKFALDHLNIESEVEEEELSPVYQERAPRRRGRSDAHATTDAVAEALKPRVVRSRSIPKLAQQPDWSNQPALPSRMPKSPSYDENRSLKPEQAEYGFQRSASPQNLIYPQQQRQQQQPQLSLAEQRLLARRQQLELTPAQSGFRTNAEARLMARKQQTQTQALNEPRVQNFRTEADRRLADRIQQMRVNSLPNQDQHFQPTSPSPQSYYNSPPTSPLPSVPKNMESNIPVIKVKVHVGSDVYNERIPKNANYNELLARVERKIRLVGGKLPGVIKLKYKDEIGNFFILNSNEKNWIDTVSLGKILDDNTCLEIYI